MTKNNYLIDISKVDLNDTFFHYTNKNNLPNILAKGLEPKIGKNSLYLEKTPKVFFVKGEKGILNIMDVWLKWLIAKGNANQVLYRIGTTYLKLPFYIKSIPNTIVKHNLKNKKKRNKIYQLMKENLDDCIFLVLNLEEKIDFDYNDIDEVKNQYPESFLKLLYTKNSIPKDKKMEYWNMHTYANKIINKEKIKLLIKQNDSTASNILKSLIENNLNYIKENCEFLYEYYQFNY